MCEKFNGFPHVLQSQQFSRQWLDDVFFPLVDEMEKWVAFGRSDALANKRMVTFFYQPSTRTRASFEFAMDNMGGRVVFSTDNAREFSSGAKGETLKDTLRVLNRYHPDVIVLRYDRQIENDLDGYVSSVPIINAGDRNPGQHPTQALLDLWTIRRCKQKIDGLRVAMVGDLAQGRTVRSLSYLLGKYRDVHIDFVSPQHLRMHNDIKDYLARHEVSFGEWNDLRKVAECADVIYQTRTQTECGSVVEGNNNGFVIGGRILSIMKEDAIIMHPLPRIDEIAPYVDDDPRAVYLTHQIDAGLFCRMALLKMILAP